MLDVWAKETLLAPPRSEREDKVDADMAPPAQVFPGFDFGDHDEPAAMRLGGDEDANAATARHQARMESMADWERNTSLLGPNLNLTLYDAVSGKPYSTEKVADNDGEEEDLSEDEDGLPDDEEDLVGDDIPEFDMELEFDAVTWQDEEKTTSRLETTTAGAAIAFDFAMESNIVGVSGTEQDEEKTTSDASERRPPNNGRLQPQPHYVFGVLPHDVPATHSDIDQASLNATEMTMAKRARPAEYEGPSKAPKLDDGTQRQRADALAFDRPMFVAEENAAGAATDAPRRMANLPRRIENAFEPAAPAYESMESAYQPIETPSQSTLGTAHAGPYLQTTNMYQPATSSYQQTTQYPYSSTVNAYWPSNTFPTNYQTTSMQNAIPSTSNAIASSSNAAASTSGVYWYPHYQQTNASYEYAPIQQNPPNAIAAGPAPHNAWQTFMPASAPTNAPSPVPAASTSTSTQVLTPVNGVPPPRDIPFPPTRLLARTQNGYWRKEVLANGQEMCHCLVESVDGGQCTKSGSKSNLRTHVQKEHGITADFLAKAYPKS
ncbi:hypothetical protein MKEN_00182700 [Mycena kentingensis (nom. inval.)]|nr:hypothetical protein MKEN_00182700 [Mycena kentingensis (nom. inval.)]